MASKHPLSLLANLTAASRQSNTLPFQSASRRYLHRLNSPVLRVPNPTPFVPDVTTFLTLIGRGMSRHAAQIPSWEALFTLSSEQLRESGVEPARSRRYLLWWRERFRNGMFGIGGDCKDASDGVAELRVVEVEANENAKDRFATMTKAPFSRKMVVNLPRSITLEKPPTLKKEGEEENEEDVEVAIAPPPRISLQEARKRSVQGTWLVRGSTIGGTGVEYVKGHQGVAKLAAREGLWEHRRGHKVDGGERRKAEVRYKRRVAERNSR
ncbi:hypothetical protein K431DRAFT_289358 [Polychaeton citri CBS 116435]|uniref:Small ribosomal subunit protein mS41 n=1 Tax=Polychaeton citri CBS 116435 TaxID=1314669 RepID=A0A9P4PYQ4_9PEZI|nr:hypothetical protein K431DRAFT_289358 [Polychaeton citri CBS 116435]